MVAAAASGRVAVDWPPISPDNIYFISANGTFNANTGGVNFGDSFVKLSPIRHRCVDYFTPHNQASLKPPTSIWRRAT